MPGLVDLGGDRRDLLGRLALAEDDLGHALAQRAVVIDGREAEVAERQALELGHRVTDGDVAGADALEELTQKPRFHPRELD